MFLLLLALPALVWAARRRRAGSLRFSSVDFARGTGQSWRQRLAGLPGLLRGAALVLMTVALARPQRGLERVREVNKGIAVEMIVDRSSSMGAEMAYGGRRMNRLDAVKEVFRAFVLGGDGLKGRPNDLVGMIAFARYADTVCPLTLAHGTLDPFLQSVQLVRREAEDGTAIGDAVALAAARLKTAEETLAAQARDKGRRYEIKSKIAILLTDGENNCGTRSPEEAAELAARWGIKIYTIGVGGGGAMNRVRTFLGNFMMPAMSRIDEGTLKVMAEKTGGVYRRADSAEALADIYREIDQLERSEIESVRFVDYQERFVPWALAALAAVLVETTLRATLFRRIP
jgi:Ca-activated chloride channel family protein